MKAPKIIAEIGCNHKGDMAIAREMIMTAATYCKVDVVKFQKRCNKELLTPEEYNAPHPHPENSYGKTYGEHREFLEFNLDQHKQLQEWCNEFGVEYSDIECCDGYGYRIKTCDCTCKRRWNWVYS